MAMVNLEDSCVSTTLQSLADSALHDLIQRTGIIDHSDQSVPPLAGWIFNKRLDDIDPNVQRVCAPQIQFLRDFTMNWRPGRSAKMGLPEDWEPKEIEMKPSEDSKTYMARCELDVWAQEAGDVFSSLSQTEVLARHHDSSSFEPDFLLSVASRCVGYTNSIEEALQINAAHSLEHFKAVVLYAGDEMGAGAAISGAFMCIPGCWMRCNPLSRFPARVAGSHTSPAIDFALLLNYVGSSRELGLRRDRRLRIDLMHPALIVGVKGPATWSKVLASPKYLRQPINMDNAIENLAMAVQSSLYTHLLNWQLRCEQMDGEASPSNRRLPPWFMLFGVIYDAEQIIIVAHIPFVDIPTMQATQQQSGASPSRFSYLSCVVDSIPFASAPTTAQLSQSWYIDRFRAAFALFSLQKHAFRLASLWECVAWPPEISVVEANLEREYLGPTPTPSIPEVDHDFPDFTIPGSEWSLTSAEQQEEIDLEIAEREAHAREIFPDLLKWVGNVADCVG